MFSTLSERLNQTFKNLTGKGRLTEENIQASLREVRVSLLEADVALSVVKQFIEDVKNKAIGQNVVAKIDPGQALIKIVQDELTHVMGDKCAELDLKTTPPAVILMAGLQGSGKTTTVAKLAKLLKEKYKKSVMVTSADVYRPAAIEQLATLAQSIDINYFPSDSKEKPLNIAKTALAEAKKQLQDVLIIDTAGRLHIDDDMMDEIKAIHNEINPTETLFVVDSMTGQDAANTAKAFNDALALSGVILTKTDGDARGGAALSVRMITGKPIKFMGVGEKIDALEAFHPERVASRILGMGDILSLVEEAERKIDKKEAAKAAKKLKKGKFDFNDFREQLDRMNDMGGISKMVTKLPGMGNLAQMKDQVNDKAMIPLKAIIDSMTDKERRFPELLNGSRKRRIAKGSGTDIQAINRLLKQFKMMQKMMKKLSKKGGMAKMMRGLQGMMPPGGGLPPM